MGLRLEGIRIAGDAQDADSRSSTYFEHTVKTSNTTGLPQRASSLDLKSRKVSFTMDAGDQVPRGLGAGTSMASRSLEHRIARLDLEYAVLRSTSVLPVQ